MIYISSALNPHLRDRTAYQRLAAVPELRLADGVTEEEERERFYIVTSFKCPARCQFCLFVRTAGAVPDCSDETMADRVRAVLRAFPGVNFSISITGGEPLLVESRVRAILDAIQAETTPDRVRWIGFGTSGIKIPVYLNEYPKFHFDVHLSRHHYERDAQEAVFGLRNIRTAAEFRRSLDAHVNIRLTCNLIRGGVDSVPEIRRYLEWAAGTGITAVTFRELNKIAGDARMYPQQYIQDYVTYYGDRIVPLETLLRDVERDAAFAFVSQDVRPFIYHERWAYRGVDVTFRRVDEEQLVNYNASFNDIDEIVLHPDGLVTGCWDRSNKILDFGGR